MIIAILLLLFFLVIPILLIFVVYPVIYNFYLIPDMERRIGQKLQYGSGAYVWASLYFFIIGGKYWARYSDLVPYIASKYINKKFNISFFKIDKGSALYKINYDISNASKLEIFMSLFFMIYGILTLIASFVALWLLKK